MIPTTWSEGNIVKLSKNIHIVYEKILRYFGIPPKLVDLIKAFYTEYNVLLVAGGLFSAM